MSYKEITSDDLFKHDGEEIGIKFLLSATPDDIVPGTVKVEDNVFLEVVAPDKKASLSVYYGSDYPSTKFYAKEIDEITRKAIKISNIPVKGWELLKLIDDGFINEHDTIIYDEAKYKLMDDAIKGATTLAPMHNAILMTGTFTVKKAKFYTLSNAIASGKNIKHTSMDNFVTMNKALSLTAMHDEATAKHMLEAEEWEIED